MGYLLNGALALRQTLLGAALFVASSCANASLFTVIDFDEIDTSGGISGIGSFYSSVGVFFNAADWLALLEPAATSAPNIAVMGNTSAYMNVVDGFTGTISFTYGIFVDSTVSVYDGLSGSGNQLASINLAANDPMNFDLAAINFAGTAQSVIVESNIGAFAWDDVTFTRTVPVPSSLLLLGLGLGLVALGSRRRPGVRRYAHWLARFRLPGPTHDF